MTNAPKRKFLDREHPMFRNFWVRGLTVAIPGAMAILEISHASPGWAVVFGGAAGWALWELFLRK